MIYVVYHAPMAERTRAAKPAPSTAGTDRPGDARAAAQMEVADALVHLSRAIEAVYTRVAQEHDLAPVQAKLVCILAAAPCTMGELGRHLGVEKAAVTGLIDRAERRGLVVRKPVVGDRRSFNVVLTDVGRRSGQAFHANVTSELERLVTPLSEANRARFVRTLAMILAASPSAGRCVLATPETKET